MIVYHYLNHKWGLQSLEKRRLRISIVHELKDPFEHRAILIDEQLEPFFDKMIVDMAKPDAMREHGQGIICFSETCECPVMWSMYADNHQGVCLGFEIPEELGALYKVHYVNERVRFAGSGLDTMRACITHKFDGWQYEREQRLLIALQEANREDGNYFAHYDANLALRSVGIGLKSAVTAAHVTQALGELSNDVDVYKVCRSRARFSITRPERGD